MSEQEFMENLVYDSIHDSLLSVDYYIGNNLSKVVFKKHNTIIFYIYINDTIYAKIINYRGAGGVRYFRGNDTIVQPDDKLLDLFKNLL